MTTIIVTDVLTITFCLLEYTVVPLLQPDIRFIIQLAASSLYCQRLYHTNTRIHVITPI